MSETKSRKKTTAKKKGVKRVKPVGNSKKIEQQAPSPGKKQRSSAGKKKVVARSAAKKKGSVTSSPESPSDIHPAPKPSALMPATGPSSRRDFIDIIAACPKFAGTLERPEYRRREGEHYVAVTVEDEARDLVVPLFKYPRGQRCVAIIVPIENTSESRPWLEMNPEQPLQASKPSGFDSIYEVRGPFLADILGMTLRNLQHIAQKNPHIKLGRGRWDMVATVKAYLAQIIGEYKGKGGKEFSDVRTREKTAGAEIKELELAEKLGELVRVEDINALAHKTGLEYRRAIENLPARLAAELSATKTPDAARRLLSKEIKTILVMLTNNSTSTTTRKQRTNGSDSKQARKRK